MNQRYSDLQPRLRIPIPRKLIMPAVQVLQKVLQLVYCLQKWYNDVKGQVEQVGSLADGKICQKTVWETHNFTITTIIKQTTIATVALVVRNLFWYSLSTLRPKFGTPGEAKMTKKEKEQSGIKIQKKFKIIRKQVP